MEKKIKNLLKIFLDSIRDYEHESGKSIYNDERDSMEFIEIFINSEDAFEYHNLLKILHAQHEGQNVNGNEPSKEVCGCHVDGWCHAVYRCKHLIDGGRCGNQSV